MKKKNLTTIILCGFGIIIFFLGLLVYFTNMGENEDKVETVGSVIETSSYKHNKSQRVLVSYDVNGITYQCDIYISTKERNIYIGREIDIYYYKDDPTKIYKKTELSFIINFYLIGISLIILGGVIFYRDNKEKLLIKRSEYKN